MKTQEPKETKLEYLNYWANRIGMYVKTYNPGDGLTRYRFFANVPGQSEKGYFEDACLGTALTFAGAKTWLEGATAAVNKMAEIHGWQPAFTVRTGGKMTCPYCGGNDCLYIVETGQWICYGR